MIVVTDGLPANEDAVRDLIRYYTRESGVRSLERELSRLARKAVREIERLNPAAVRADTICYATKENQTAAENLAKELGTYH